MRHLVTLIHLLQFLFRLDKEHGFFIQLGPKLPYRAFLLLTLHAGQFKHILVLTLHLLVRLRDLLQILLQQLIVELDGFTLLDLLSQVIEQTRLLAEQLMKLGVISLRDLQFMLQLTILELEVADSKHQLICLRLLLDFRV
jgi:hypothetical protein